jgi:hypothetical protein
MGRRMDFRVVNDSGQPQIRCFGGFIDLLAEKWFVDNLGHNPRRCAKDLVGNIPQRVVGRGKLV